MAAAGVGLERQSRRRPPPDQWGPHGVKWSNRGVKGPYMVVKDLHAVQGGGLIKVRCRHWEQVACRLPYWYQSLGCR